MGKPYSTIFLIRSNMTPTDNEMTVKAEMANIIGGIICPNNHLSIKGIEYQGEIIKLIVFVISDWFDSFKRRLFVLYNFLLDYKILMIHRPLKDF